MKMKLTTKIYMELGTREAWQAFNFFFFVDHIVEQKGEYFLLKVAIRSNVKVLDHRHLCAES